MDASNCGGASEPWKWIRVSQTCLGANVPWRKRAFGLGTKYGFLEEFLGHSWGLVYREGGAPGTVPLRNLRVTAHVLHQDVPLEWYWVRFFWIFWGHSEGPGEGRGGAPGTVPLQIPQVTSRKACLRNAEWRSSCKYRPEARFFNSSSLPKPQVMPPKRRWARPFVRVSCVDLCLHPICVLKCISILSACQQVWLVHRKSRHGIADNKTRSIPMRLKQKSRSRPRPIQAYTNFSACATILAPIQTMSEPWSREVPKEMLSEGAIPNIVPFPPPPQGSARTSASESAPLFVELSSASCFGPGTFQGAFWGNYFSMAKCQGIAQKGVRAFWCSKTGARSSWKRCKKPVFTLRSVNRSMWTPFRVILWGWLIQGACPRAHPPASSSDTPPSLQYQSIGAKINANFFAQSFSTTLRVMDVRAKNHGGLHQKVHFPVAAVVGETFDPWASGRKVRNVRGKSGPKSLCLCCFYFPESRPTLPATCPEREKQTLSERSSKFCFDL